MDGRRGILGACWSQDDALFTLATEAGFYVYQSDPLSLLAHRGEFGLACLPFLARLCSREPRPLQRLRVGDTLTHDTLTHAPSSLAAAVGGLRHAALLNRSNCLALVGGGRKPLESPNKGTQAMAWRCACLRHAHSWPSGH